MTDYLSLYYLLPAAIVAAIFVTMAARMIGGRRCPKCRRHAGRRAGKSPNLLGRMMKVYRCKRCGEEFRVAKSLSRDYANTDRGIRGSGSGGLGL